MLIERGADLTAKDEDGSTPLHLASAPQKVSYFPQEQVELVHVLLDHGADVNSRSNDGSTPFCLASRHGHTEIVQVLVEHGADSQPGVHYTEN